MLSDRHDVTLLCGDERLLNNVLPPGADRELAEAIGGRVWYSETVAAVTPDGPGGALQVRCDSGRTVDADCIVAGVGARPSTALVEGQLELTGSKHIVVSSTLETSQRGVYAAGDVIAFPVAGSGGGMTTLANVTHARASARFAVGQMIDGAAGGTADGVGYSHVPRAYSRIVNAHGTYSWELYGTSGGGTPTLHRLPAATTGPLGAVWAADRVTAVFLSGGTPGQNADAERLVGGTAADADVFFRSLGLVGVPPEAV